MNKLNLALKRLSWHKAVRQNRVTLNTLNVLNIENYSILLNSIHAWIDNLLIQYED